MPKIFRKEQHVLRMPSLPTIKGSAHWVFLYLGYKEVTGERPSLGEINNLLSQLSLVEVVAQISRLLHQCAETLTPDYTSDCKFQARMEMNYFTYEWRRRICRSRWGVTQTDCVIFHRQQLLFVLDLALENCSLDKKLESVWDDESRHKFGLACLMANDLLAKSDDPTPTVSTKKERRALRSQVTDEQKWDVRASTLPSLDFDYDRNVRNHHSRALALWLKLPQSQALKDAAGKEWIDWETEFENYYGVTLPEFICVVGVLWVYIAQLDGNDSTTLGRNMFNPHHILQHTAINPQKVTNILRIITSTPQKARDAALLPRQRRGWDLTFLRTYPLLDIGNGLVVVTDPILLLKSISEGPYFLIQKALPDVKAFGNMFGHVYDYHISAILKDIVANEKASDETDAQPLGRYHPHVSFKTKKNDEFSDGLIIYEHSLVLIEAKGSLLTTRAKYSGDGTALKQDVDGKFGTKTGAHQIAKVIQRFIKGEKPNVPSLNVEKIRRIYPILVCYDTAPTTHLLFEYLDDVFQKSLGDLPSKGPRVGKLIVLSTFEVEALEAVCKSVPLEKVLYGYEKDLSGMPFSTYLVGNYSQFLNDTRIGAVDSVRDYTELVRDTLFPGAPLPE